MNHTLMQRLRVAIRPTISIAFINYKAFSTNFDND